MALYYVWHPPASRRKQEQIKQLQAEIDAAQIMIDRNGTTFRLRGDGTKQIVPQTMVPKKVRAEVAQHWKGVIQ